MHEYGGYPPPPPPPSSVVVLDLDNTNNDGCSISSSSSWFLQYVVTALLIALVVLHLVKNTASKYFVMVDSTATDFHHSHSSSSSPRITTTTSTTTTTTREDTVPPFRPRPCAICGNSTTKQCSGCKLVSYCSAACQGSHWSSGHRAECKDFQLSGKVSSKQSPFVLQGRKGHRAVSLVPARLPSRSIKHVGEILYPYEDFAELYNWDIPSFPPCGLLNCGNSCFANVVLQCLSYTRPLVAYLMEKGHREECRRNDWCFLCEFQTHFERASTSRQPFSPVNILSRLPNIGGNLGYGKQEDAHEFMRFAIDTMQSVCLDEFGGEKVLHPSTQETTLVQHIFGGHLQSQVVCSKCCNISNQCENMMDLTVEIHGDAASLEECLDQFTAREKLHGDNLYKCDGCNDYVMAWKRLMIRRAPNILTIALKRFQSGRFGKLNKRITFPETLHLSPYMTEERDGSDVYKLYAVVVHVDMLNASFFGHYICYTKDFHGNWYRIDDCKVSRVDLEDVLSEGAYMLLYSRVCPRPSCLKPIESVGKELRIVEVAQAEDQSGECLDSLGSTNDISKFGCISSDANSQPNVSARETDFSPPINVCENVREDVEMADSESCPCFPSQNMNVGSRQDLNLEKETPPSPLDTSRMATSSSVVGPQGRAESCAEILTYFSIENSQCSDSVDSKREQATVEIKNGSSSSSGKRSAICQSAEGSDPCAATKFKPLFAPGFLGKRPGNASLGRRMNGPLNSSELASSWFQSEPGPGTPLENRNRIKDVQRPHSECNGFLLPPCDKQTAN